MYPRLFSLQLWVNSRLGSLTLVWQPVKEKENSEFKSVKQHFEIDLVLHPAWVMAFIICLFGVYGISTFVGYLMLNPFLYK